MDGLAAYYTESGNPPGRWLGSGLPGIGGEGHRLAPGDVVTEEQMAHMFGHGADPVTGAALGRGHRVFARAGRKAVAGFDLTFSARKSVSVLWALGDDSTRQAVLKAHHAAVSSVLAYAEATAVRTRTGKDGAAQVPTRGVIAAAFDHWDSRTGDPQLHSHVVIANKVQGLDGRWRSLDSRGLHHAAVTLSELYDNVLADHLTAALGVGWGFRARGARRPAGFEIDGIDDALLEVFSTRSASIEDRLRELRAAFKVEHGHEPSAVAVTKLRQQATLETRPAKTLRRLRDQLAAWGERARSATGTQPRDIAARSLDGGPRVLLAHDQVSPATVGRLAGVVLDAVAQRRAVFSTWSIRAEVQRTTRGLRMATAGDRIALADRVTTAVQGLAVSIEPPLAAGGTGAAGRVGMEEFTHPDVLEAEARLLDAHLHDHAAPVAQAATVQRFTTTAQPPRSGCVTGTLPLAPDQAAAVMDIACSGRRIEVLLGPAGTGKTTALAALASAWETRHGRGSVIGLAPSAAAAAELAASLGISCDNTTKWLHESTGDGHFYRSAARAAISAKADREAATGSRREAMRLYERVHAIDAETRRWQMAPGHLVIVDEAAMAATGDLDALRAQAVAAGAKLVLVGDHAQLPAVGAGGAFGLLAESGDPVVLSSLWRFAHRWEADATRALRTGDTAALDAYDDHGRIVSGPRGDVIDAAYTAWATDTRAGRSCLLIAHDNDTVTELNDRAHHDLSAAEAVTGPFIALGGLDRGGHRGHAAAGGLVLTRRNDRRLRLPDGTHVRNGDLWRVTAVHPDGALSVTRTSRDDTPAAGDDSDHALAVIRLPAGYVAQHVDPGYATTVHRAQGLTVERTHVIVSAGMTREALYVAMTRGRDTNRAYVATGTDHDDCADTHGPAPDLFSDLEAGREILAGVLANPVAPRSAVAAMAEARAPYEAVLGGALEETLALAHRLIADREGRPGPGSGTGPAGPEIVRPPWLPPAASEGNELTDDDLRAWEHRMEPSAVSAARARTPEPAHAPPARLRGAGGEPIAPTAHQGPAL